MKKVMILAVLAAAGFVGASQAAPTGTINFTGQLTDNTCDVNIDGQGVNPLIHLPTIQTSQLQTQGEVAGRTGFNVALTNCTAPAQSGVSVFFQAGDTVDQITGRLKNTDVSTTGATNVSLQLLDATNSFAPIKAGNQSQVTDTSYVEVAEDGSATVPYAVEYYADDATTAGMVTSKVLYSIQYN